MNFFLLACDLQVKKESAMNEPQNKVDPDQEAAWIKEIAAGNKRAFEQCYLTYQTKLFRYCFRFLGDQGTSEELVNDIMVAVWKGAGTFQGQSKVSTWIFGIAHHKVMNMIRGKKQESVEMTEETDLPSSEEMPETTLFRKEQQAQIQQAIGKLSPIHRSVLELAFYHGFSCQEVSDIMKCPVNTVKTRLFYAKQQLATLLKGIGDRP